jgi:predicted enzyme related to lactoylglutathione lyase
MRRVIGLGGVFFKARDPEALYVWYEKHLGIKRDDPHSAIFHNKGDEDGLIVWSIFPADTKYFEPSGSSIMINYRVENLDALLDALTAEGVQVDPKREEHDYGKFGWIMDPEGNRIELWEPKGGF